MGFHLAGLNSKRKNGPQWATVRKCLTCSWRVGKMKEQAVSVPLGTGIALSWLSWVAQVGLLSQDIPLIPTSPGCKAQMECGCWCQGYSLKESVLLGAEDEPSENHKYSSWIQSNESLWGASFFLVERIIDIDFFSTGNFAFIFRLFSDTTFWNKILSTGYIECQGYAQPLIYCPISLWSEWIGMTIWFKQLLLALPQRF